VRGLCFRPVFITAAGLSAIETMHDYKRLGQVQSSFAQLKDVIELRSAWHGTDGRVRERVQVAALALLLERSPKRLGSICLRPLRCRHSNR